MNYATLQTRIQDTLQRGDVAQAVPGWIELAEARFNRELRVRQMITRATAILQESFIRLPSDWLETRNLEVEDDSERRPLQLVSMQESDKIKAEASTGALFYVIHGDSIEIKPFVSEPMTLEMTYYASIPALSSSNTTNWLLTAWPDLYLYASLLHSAPYLDRDKRLATWEAMASKLIEDIRLQDIKAQWSGSPLRIRSAAVIDH